MPSLTPEIAASIAADLVADGFATCTAASVEEVAQYGSVAPGTISDAYDEHLTDAILERLFEVGIEV